MSTNLHVLQKLAKFSELILPQQFYLCYAINRADQLHHLCCFQVGLAWNSILLACGNPLFTYSGILA